MQCYLNVTSVNDTSTNWTAYSPVFERWDPTALLYTHRPSAAIIDMYVTPIWYIIGFPGNLLAFFVWIQKRMRPSSGTYLAALAMVDFIFLIMHLMFELQTVWHISAWHVPVWCELFPILMYSSQYLSPLLVLAFTVERYISICHPFQREKYCTTRRAIIVIISLVVISLSLHAIQGYFWIYRKEDQSCRVRESVTVNDTKSLWSIWGWVTELLAFGVVPLVILTLNIFVMNETRRMTARFNELSSTPGGGSTNSSATTVTLLAVSFFLIFSTLPVTVFYALVLNFPESVLCVTDEGIATHAEMQNYFLYWYWRILIQELGMSHYACNIIIYLLTGMQFRRELLALVRRVGCCFSSGANDRGFTREEKIRLTTTNVISVENGKSSNGVAVDMKNGNGNVSGINRT